MTCQHLQDDRQTSVVFANTNTTAYTHVLPCYRPLRTKTRQCDRKAHVLHLAAAAVALVEVELTARPRIPAGRPLRFPKRMPQRTKWAYRSTYSATGKPRSRGSGRRLDERTTLVNAMSSVLYTTGTQKGGHCGE